MSGRKWTDEREALPPLIAVNRQRRAAAESESEAGRAELHDLLVRGQAVAFDVAEMARLAGISRQTAHKILRQAGSKSWRARHDERRRNASG